jgi:predicted nucleic acid-binding protein
MNGQINAVLFDTNTVLRSLKERNIAATLSNAFPEAMRYISVITYIELLSYHKLTLEEESEILRFLSSVTVVSLSDEIVQKTIDFRRKTNRKTPDSIIAATTIELGATLITQDAHLLGLDFLGFNSISIADLFPVSEPPSGRIITS